jgi:hypothetical protein
VHRYGADAWFDYDAEDELLETAGVAAG